jgi:uncharacterized protein (TIGR02284 family)
MTGKKITRIIVINDRKKLPMEKSEVISTLNDLLNTTKDGEDGFQACAEQVKSANLKSVFETAASRCREGAHELESHIRALGGDPSDSGTISGALHRAWTGLKSSITSMDDHAVLEECERSEDAAKSAYEAALKKDLPADIRTVVERQYLGVKENHDHVRDLRNSTRAA